MTTTTIAVLGAGRVGGNLARGLSAAGHTVTLGVRDPNSSREHWAETAVAVANPRSAIRSADLVVNATPGDTTLERLTELRGDLAGRILLDLSNATVRTPNGFPGALLYLEGSLGERLQQTLPDTRVVKALNLMLLSVMTAPASLSTPPTAFLSGDDAAAKQIVREVLLTLGWEEQWTVDPGPIHTAAGTEAIALLIPSLLGALGFVPFAVSLSR